MPRTKEFNPDRVLDKAMQVFWEKGYESTSMQDLVNRMGINRFSIYSSFGDKHQLFLKALDRYRDEIIPSGIGILEQFERGTEAIREFFKMSLEFFLSRRGRHGCLMINSTVELAPNDRMAARRVNAHSHRVEKAFYRALAYERNHGNYRGKQNIRDIARFLTGALLGLGAMARGAVGRPVLESYVKVSLSVLD